MNNYLMNTVCVTSKISADEYLAPDTLVIDGDVEIGIFTSAMGIFQIVAVNHEHMVLLNETLDTRLAALERLHRLLRDEYEV